MYFIFIGGASASGKSTIAERLIKRLCADGVNAKKLNNDDYFRERPDGISNESFRQTTKFDVPHMLHLDRLNRDIHAFSQGRSVLKSLLSFTDNKYYAWELISPPQVVIIEGIFAQYLYQVYVDKRLPSLLVNVTTDGYQDLMNRRIARDVKERNRTPEAVVACEQKTVGPGFFKYTASNAQGADVYIINKRHANLEERNKAMDASVNEIMECLDELRARGSQQKSKKPEARELIARSHWCAGEKSATIDKETHRFLGIFNGVFGTTEGTYEREFTEEERNPSFKRN